MRSPDESDALMPTTQYCQVCGRVTSSYVWYVDRNAIESVCTACYKKFTSDVAILNYYAKWASGKLDGLPSQPYPSRVILGDYYSGTFECSCFY